MRKLAYRIGRRGYDFASVSGVLLVNCHGRSFFLRELAQPPDDTFAWMLNVVCHLCLMLALASWIGTSFHGPGRVPKAEQEMRMLPTMASALSAAGTYCERPFTAENDWCSECNSWKPVLAHHCKYCQCCSMWMDHHCFFAAQCIGFRNLRCFLLWLCYTAALLQLLMLATVRRFFVLPVDRGLCIHLLAFAVFLALFWWRVVNQLLDILNQIFAGWASRVLCMKFRGILTRARTAVKTLEAQELGCETSSARLQPLQRACKRVNALSGFCRGLFVASHAVESLAFVFGEPPSLLWLLPLRAGGTGQPLEPTACDQDACVAWSALGEVLATHGGELQSA